MNEDLENMILYTLSKRGIGMRETSMLAMVRTAYSDRLLDDEKIMQSVRRLKDLGMVMTFPDFRGRPLYALTDTGAACLREQGL